MNQKVFTPNASNTLNTALCQASSHYVVGLTGGIGSGKSTATDWFSSQGVTVIDADVIARQVVAKGTETLKRIAEKFGDWVLTEAGELNRPELREYVFNQSNALVELESITHPAIREQAKLELQEAKSAYVIISAPLLLEAAEAGLANLCHRILLIDAPEELQILRASQRDGQNEQKIRAVMGNQLSRNERQKLANDVVMNAGSLEDLFNQLVPLHEQYLSFAQSK